MGLVAVLSNSFCLRGLPRPRQLAGTRPICCAWFGYWFQTARTSFGLRLTIQAAAMNRVQWRSSSGSRPRGNWTANGLHPASMACHSACCGEISPRFARCKMSFRAIAPLSSFVDIFRFPIVSLWATAFRAYRIDQDVELLPSIVFARSVCVTPTTANSPRCSRTREIAVEHPFGSIKQWLHRGPLPMRSLGNAWAEAPAWPRSSTIYGGPEHSRRRTMTAGPSSLKRRSNRGPFPTRMRRADAHQVTTGSFPSANMRRIRRHARRPLGPGPDCGVFRWSVRFIVKVKLWREAVRGLRAANARLFGGRSSRRDGHHMVTKHIVGSGKSD